MSQLRCCSLAVGHRLAGIDLDIAPDELDGGSAPTVPANQPCWRPWPGAGPGRWWPSLPRPLEGAFPSVLRV